MTGTDKELFSRQIAPHLDVLFRAAFRLTRNQADAEDLVQETCLRACEHLELAGSERSRAWLLRVLNNLFVDGFRRARRSPIDSTGHDGDAAAASDGHTPEESLATSEREAELERAWQRLDRGHRALLGLRAEGYSLAEIADITSIGRDALTMRLYRARQSLTQHLNEVREQEPKTRLEAVK